MLETLFPLFGKSLESDAIKKLFADWKVEFPSKITSTPNNSTVKTKMKKDGVILYFRMGGYSKYLKPIPAKTKNSYIGIFTMIEIDKKCPLDLPLGVSHKLSNQELTNIMGEPRLDTFMGESRTWKKNFTDKHEINVTRYTDNSKLDSITIAFTFEPDL